MRFAIFVPVFAAALALTASASADVSVVATTPSLGSLAQEVGGGHVSVKTLAQPNQDPHFVDGRPSYVLALNRADLLVYVGLGLEGGWLPDLVTNARNGDIQRGRPGHLDASTAAPRLLEKGGDRSMGDVHPGGNPHYLYDPRYGVAVAEAIADRLARIDATHADEYRDNARDFASRMKKRIAKWERKMRPHRGEAVVGYHKSLVYLAEWLGLERAGFVEPQPGISPNPRHLAKLILNMKRKGVKAVISEPWYDAESSRVVARRAGAELVRLPGDVGASGVGSYAQLVDRIVDALDHALR